MQSNSIISEMEAICSIMSGKQKEFQEQLLKDAKPVICVPLSEVFSSEEIKTIKKIVKPQVKQCYRNAHLLAALFEEAKYCEGKVSLCGMPISTDHAFNLVRGKYVDVTFELALEKDVREETYVSLGEYTFSEIEKVTGETGYYGNVYQSFFYKRNRRKVIKRK